MQDSWAAKAAKDFITTNDKFNLIATETGKAMEQKKDKVRAFLSQFFNTAALGDDDDIFALGFVNSLFAMQLVMFVEQEFSTTVEDEDLEIDNFKSINAIVSLIERKASSTASA